MIINKKAALFQGGERTNHIVGSLSFVLPALAASVRLSDSVLGCGGVRSGPVVGATESKTGEFLLFFCYS